MESLSELNPEQYEAVTHFEGPLLIIAGAGSGKTRVITHRIAYLIGHHGVSPEEILGVTFTNKAAEEMRERVARLLKERKPPWIKTFHSTCARILRDHIHLLGYSPNFTILDERDSRELLARTLKELGVEGLSPAVVANLIERAKDELLGPEGFLQRYSGRLDDYLLEAGYNAYKRYQEALERSNSLDFADLIRLAVRLLQDNLQILNLYRERFRFILIDEYQDINYAQYLLARLLAERYGNICVVGDDDQAIYAWRGADPGWLLRFEEDFPNTRVIRLRVNYRSPGRVLRAALSLVKNNRRRQEKELEAIKGEGEPIRLYAALDGLDEAHYVAAQIEHLRDVEGVELSEIAVLYRVNTLSRVIEEALIVHGIPYEVVRGLRFYERLEVKDLICYLRLVVNPADELSLLRIINRPRRGIGERTIEAIQSYAKREGLSLWEALKRSCSDASAEGSPNVVNARARARIEKFIELIEGLRRRMGELGPAELAELVLKRTGYLEALQGDPTAEERLGNIKELLGQLREHRSLEGFLEGIALLSEADGRSPTGRVALMTLHVAKGLEFDVVFIIGLEEGLLPHSRAIQEGEIEEERRLAYVGMTRAKWRLYLSFAAQRSLYGSLMLNPPSRFLTELPQGELESAALGLRLGDGF